MHANLGSTYSALGRSVDALVSYDRALRLNPRFAGAWANRGKLLLSLQRPDDALASFDQVLRLDAPSAEIFFYKGQALHRLARRSDALDSYDQALRLNREFAEAFNNRGMVLHEMGRHGDALLSVDEALRLAPKFGLALHNRAIILLALLRYDEARESADRAIALDPNSVDSLNCRAGALLQLNQPHQAMESLECALRLQPGHPEAQHNLGIALRDLRRFEESVAAFSRVLAADADHVPTLSQLGATLLSAGRFEAARECYQRLLTLAPEREYALGNLLHAQKHCADWSSHSETSRRILDGIQAGRRVDLPFSLLAITDRLTAQRQCAEIFRAHMYPPHTPLWRGERYAHTKIRIAYLSSDLREHAVSFLLAGVIELHDRARFEVIAISLLPPDSNAWGQRVRQAFDRFIDVSQHSDSEIAAQIRSLEIDILIDLNGYTRGMRSAILARHAAAVQVGYLGFPATMGASYMDYLIADEFVIPAHSQVHYSEKIAYLPHCFQANDAKKERVRSTAGRTELRIPQRGVLLCCFNNTYKLNPECFDIWMRVLRNVPESRLWLLADSELVKARLSQGATDRGVDPARLLFAQHVPYVDHLSRLALADLFLDTLPFNGGTTVSDALWAGVPVLTCTGEAFAARMAGSLLNSLGLTELITRNGEEYERCLLDLARDPEKLAGLRRRLVKERDRAPLFDTPRFTRHLEAAYIRMHERSLAGQPPASFQIAEMQASGQHHPYLT